MEFSGFHKFQGEGQLVRLVEKLYEDKYMSERDYNLFWVYHRALIQKLRSAFYYRENLTRYLGDSDPAEVIKNPDQFVFNVNRYADGFFHSLGSATDIFARELIFLHGQPMPANVYFGTAYQKLSALTPPPSFLGKINSPAWLLDFKKYRNVSTHELLIVSNYKTKLEVKGKDFSSTIEVLLPDDPQLDYEKRTYANEKELMNYCGNMFFKSLSLLNSVYTKIAASIKTANAIPLSLIRIT